MSDDTPPRTRGLASAGSRGILMPFHSHLNRNVPDYKLAIQQAARVLQECAVIEPPVIPTAIAEAYRIRVFFGKFPEDAAQVSGFYVPSEMEIFVNDADPPNRQTFTIAHELGHHFLHREAIIEHPEDYRVFMRSPLGAERDPLEQEANAFAAHLLVPREFLEKYWDVASPRELSRLFNVSDDVIRFRLHDERSTPRADR